MAIPTSNDLKTLNYSFNGQPYCDAPFDTDVNTWTLDYSFCGQPFVTNAATSTTTSTPLRCLMGCGS